MSLTSVVIKNIGQQLIAYESANGSVGSQPFADVITIFGKLQKILSKLAGISGYNSLLRRSLMMGKTKAKSLEMIQIRSDGALELNVAHAANSHLLLEESAGDILLTQFLGLLVTFIGETLTVNLLRDVWPNVPFEKANVPSRDIG